MRLIDTLCHLDFQEFDEDKSNVLRQACEAGISDIIIAAADATKWPAIQSVTEEFSGISSYPRLHAAFGLHPLFIENNQLLLLDQLKSLLMSSGAVAIGECGLDYFSNEIDDQQRKLQQQIFIAQLEIAQELGLPVIIHSRKSLDEILKQLRIFKQVRGVLHSFSGSEQQARQAIDLGFLIGFGGSITYNRAQRLHKLVKRLPLDAMLLETDAPDQPDASHNGERNEPAYLPLIANEIATLREIDAELVAKTTTLNAQALFKIP